MDANPRSRVTDAYDSPIHLVSFAYSSVTVVTYTVGGPEQGAQKVTRCDFADRPYVGAVRTLEARRSLSFAKRERVGSCEWNL